MNQERITRDCECPRANHVHGTPTAYVIDKCRCIPCTEANLKREQDRRAAKKAGNYDAGRVDAEPVRHHIERLRARGYGIKQIAKLARVSNSTLGKIVYGDPSRNMPPRARVERHVADRVMAVRPSLSTVGQTTHVKAGPTQARIQSLVCLGYSIGWQAIRLGKVNGNFARVLEHDNVNAKTAREVRDLYLLLWDKPRQAANRHEAAAITRAIRYAEARGWTELPPPHLSGSEAPVNPDKGINAFLEQRLNRQTKRVSRESERTPWSTTITATNTTSISA
ncbi:helix-turn-helix DNA-binding protein [Arthrobacter phage Elesar]|uniref:Helix-turn-helix DNA binding protein n=1 Tax=Arthrobacter phage Elesar TaxID=2510522 RepID=A0A411CQL7_9CAUD|nr:helix-turn-helix DNA-binding protein [Arthrobacter phage Elesar]QAY16097.1 helix-turn-helix DNA-binding protein [Arthrobacter phage Elesar]